MDVGAVKPPRFGGASHAPAWHRLSIKHACRSMPSKFLPLPPTQRKRLASHAKWSRSSMSTPTRRFRCWSIDEQRFDMSSFAEPRNLDQEKRRRTLAPQSTTNDRRDEPAHGQKRDPASPPPRLRLQARQRWRRYSRAPGLPWLPQHSEHHAYTALTPGRFKGFFRD